MHIKEKQNARPQYRELRASSFVNSVWVDQGHTVLFANKGCEMGSPVYVLIWEDLKVLPSAGEITKASLSPHFN